jgi:hypothetical protein
VEPRLKTSTKWTALPKDFLAQIRSALKENFANQIGKGTVQVDGRIYPEEVLIRVGFAEPGRLKQSHWDVSISYKKDKDNVLKMLHLAVDAAASLFDQIFTSPDDDFPRIWQEIDFEGRKLHIQYTTENSQLEDEADRILGLKKDDLAQGDWDEDISPESIKAQLGIDGDEEELDLSDDEQDHKPKKKH